MKNLKYMQWIKIHFYWLITLITSSAYAADGPPSLGGASANVLQPLGIFTSALYNICYIVGTAFILGSFIRYKEYRQNPSETPISRPIAVFLFGVVLIAIPVIAKLSESASPLG